MGLNDIVPDDAGDGGKGGRPKEKTSKREVHGDGYCPPKNTEEWWLDVMGKVDAVGLDEMDFDETIMKVGEIADYVHLFPLEVRVKIEEHGIYETDWDAYIERFPCRADDGRLPDHVRTEKVSSEQPSKSNDDGGLMGLLNES